MSLSIGKVTAELELQDTFSKRLALATSELSKFATKASSIGDSLQSIGTKATLGLTLPIAGGVLTATKAFTTFETAMKKAQAAMADGSKTAAETAAEMTILKNAAVEWGQKTSFSAAEAGEALAELGKAGFKATEAAGALPSVLQLAEASSIGLADAASITANTMTTFGHSITDLARDNDILTKTVNSATIDIGDLRESLKYVGPIARTAGISLEEVAAATAVLSGAGIKGSMAGTTLRNTLTELMGPSKKTAELMKQLGIESFVSNGQVMGMADVIDLLAQKLPRLGGKAEQTAALITMFGDRAGPGMAAMLETGSAALRKMEDNLRNSEGTAKRAAEIMMSGLGGALERMKGAIETAAMSVGEALVPAIAWGAAILERLANLLTSTIVPAFLALPGPVQAFVFGLVGIAAAAGPVLVGLGTMAKVIPFLSGGLTLLTGALSLVTGGIVMVDGALMVALGTLNLVIPGWTLWAGAILGVAAAIITWLGGWAPMWEALQAAASWLYERLVPAFEAFGVVVTAVGTPLVWFAARLADVATAIGTLVGSALRPSWEAWKTFGAGVLDVIDVLEDVAAIAYHLGRILGLEVRAKVLEVVQAFRTWWTGATLLASVVRDVVMTQLRALVQRFAEVLGPLQTVWTAMREWAASMKGAVVGAIKDVIATLRQMFPVLDWIIEKLEWLKANGSWANLKAGIKDVRESLAEPGPADPLNLRSSADAALAKYEALKTSGTASAAAIAAAFEDAENAKRRLAADAGNPFKNYAAGAYALDAAITSVIPPAAKLKDALGGGGVAGATEKATDWLSQFKESLVELSARVTLAAKHGTSLSDMVREFGDEAVEAATKAQMWGVQVSGALATVAKAASDVEKMSAGGWLSQFRDQRTEIDVWTKAFEAAVATQEKLTEETLRAREQGYDTNARAIAQLHEELFDAIASREADSLELRLSFVHQDIQKRRAALDRNGTNYGAALAKLTQLEREAIRSTTQAWMLKGSATREQLQVTARDAEARYEAIRHSGVATAEAIQIAFEEMKNAQLAAAREVGITWTDALAQIGAALVAIGGMVGGSKGAGMAQAGQLAGMLSTQIHQYGEGNRAGIASPLFNASASKSQKLAAGIGTGVAVLGGAMDVWAATGNSKTRGGAAMSGLMAGAKAGAAFGPYGMAIGAGAGLLVGLVRGKAAWAKAQDEIARDFKGLGAISDETAKRIQEQTKTLFKGNRTAGNLFALDQIIGEGGGLTAANVVGLTAKLRDVFVMVETGAFSAAQATEVLGKNWQTFAAYAVSTGRIAGTAFNEIGEIADRMGLKIEGRSEFLQEQTAKYINALARLSAPLKGKADTAITQWSDESATASDRAKGGAALEAMLPQFNRAGRQAVAGFLAAQKAGLGYFDALETVGPALDNLIGLQEHYAKVGMEAGSAMLTQIINERKLVETHRDLVDGATAWNDAIVAGSYLGALNAEAMADFGAQGMESYDALIAAGFSHGSVMRQLQAGIQSAAERYAQLGIPMDEHTAKLVEMANAEGLLGEKGATTNQLLIDGLGALITAVGGELPESFKKAAEAAQIHGAEIADSIHGSLVIAESGALDMGAAFTEAEGNVTRFKSALGDIPSRLGVDIDLNVGEVPDWIRNPRTPEATPQVEPTTPGNEADPEYRASGGIVPSWRPRGSDVVPAMLTPGEGVVTTGGMARLGAAGLDFLNRGGAVTQGAAAGSGAVGGDVEFRLTDRGGEKLAEVVLAKAPRVLRNTGATRR